MGHMALLSIREGNNMQDVYTKEKEFENTTKDKINEFSKNAQQGIQQSEDKLKAAACEAQKRLKQGQEQVQQLISQADKQLRENPWPIVAGVAVGCLFLGFFAGNARSKN
jgi:ElaB/YqjD/DUF883 family membrane-anchored ribosome-binding protein